MKHLKLYEEYNDDNLNEDIVEAFPELSEDLIEIIALWDETPQGAEETIEKLSVMMDAYDYESITSLNTWQKYWQDTVAIYVNMGDTYITTIIFNTVEDKFEVGSIGNWIEENQEEYEIK